MDELPAGSVANSVFGNISVLRNPVKIEFYENQKPGRQQFLTEPPERCEYSKPSLPPVTAKVATDSMAKLPPLWVPRIHAAFRRYTGVIARLLR
jgi:hypothetical protein